MSNEEWADFVRNTMPAERRNLMEQHLGEGCRKCQKNLQVWHDVCALAGAERSYAPPDSVIRAVRGLLGLHRSAKPRPRALAVARLVFDSFRQPLPAGVRAGSRPPRQVLYKTGSFWVDLRLEKLPTSNRLTLVGQVLDASCPDKGMKDVPVYVLSGSHELTRTATNRFGEFHLDLTAAGRPRVCVGLSKSKAVVVPLPPLGLAQRGARRTTK